MKPYSQALPCGVFGWLASASRLLLGETSYRLGISTRQLAGHTLRLVGCLVNSNHARWCDGTQTMANTTNFLELSD